MSNILRLPETTKKVGLSRSAIYARLNPESSQYDPTFPRPKKLGSRSIGWLESDVTAWIESRTAVGA